MFLAPGETGTAEFVITAEELAEIMAKGTMEFSSEKYPNAKVVIKDVTELFGEKGDTAGDAAGFYKAELQLK